MTEVSYCVVCGKPKIKRKGALYCSVACQQKAKYQREKDNLEQIKQTGDELKDEIVTKTERIAELEMTLEQKFKKLEDLQKLIRAWEIGLKHNINADMARKFISQHLAEIKKITDTILVK
jgi:uncharacterized Zn finger protein (UPF0148 family)